MNQLGDLLFSLPVLSAARKELPEARIYSVARAEYIPLIEATGLVDSLITRGRGSVAGKIREVAKIRKEGINTGVFFSESPECLLMGFAGGIKERIGFSSASLSFLLTAKVERSGVPSLANNKRLGQKAGLKNIPADYKGLLKIPAKAAEEAVNWLKENGIEAVKYAVIAPGASKKRRNKYWAAEKWERLAGNIIDRGLTPIFSGAPGEGDELESLAAGLNGKAKVFVSESGILQFAALIQKADIFIGIDSGAMHLAASLGARVVALFGRTDPRQVGPMPLENHSVIKKDSMESISTEEVWEKVSKIIA